MSRGTLDKFGELLGAVGLHEDLHVVRASPDRIDLRISRDDDRRQARAQGSSLPDHFDSGDDRHRVVADDQIESRWRMLERPQDAGPVGCVGHHVPQVDEQCGRRRAHIRVIVDQKDAKRG